MKRVILGTILITVFSLLYFCNSVEPPPGEKPTLNLHLEDISCIDAWIELTTTNLQLPATITLKQNNQTRSTINLVKADTLLYIDSLLPNQNYSFHAAMQPSNNADEVKSNVLSVTTLDTTSHNFTFETWTFGEHSSNVLYDVAIIDENNIWAVGEIYMNDSLGNPDPTFYNVAHWDGQIWELKRIFYKGGIWTIRTIFAFNATDIWFSAFVRYDGQNFIELPIPSILIGWSINKIWGSSSNDLYVVGNEGNIAHYQNGQWSRIESGTNLHIYDIWGGYNSETDQDEILCIASNSDIFIDNSKVLKIEGTSIKEMNNEGLPIFISTIWFIPERKYFIAGDGLYTAKYLWEKWVRDYTMPPYYKTGIRGNGFNDIVMVGTFGLFMHFNGLSWINYNSMPNFSGSYGEVKIKGDILACTGGLNDGKAIITIGRR